MRTEPSTRLPAGIVFDMDGVLLESEELHVESWHEYLGAHGLTKSQAFYESFIGAADRVLVRHLIESGELTGTEPFHTDGKRGVYTRILREKGRLYPGARELLASLAAHRPAIRLALATSACRPEVAIARELGLDGCFQVLVTTEDVTHPKPHPEVYLQAARRLEVAPEACVAVEDSVPGVSAARAAGMAVIAVSQTQPAANLAEADLVLPALTELAERPELFRKVLSARRV